MASIFAGKLVAITGAASGIGRATALLLASRGARLALADVNEAGLTSVASEVRKEHASRHDAAAASATDAITADVVTTTVVDVRSQESCRAWISDAVAHFRQPLDGAANLAGVIGRSISQEKGSVRNITDEEFDWVMEVNVKGTLNCLRAELPHMKQDGVRPGEGSAIVNASSTSGLVGFEYNVPYVAAKHAIVGITRTVAKEEGGKGIRANAIAPGIIATPMMKGIEEAKGTADLFDGKEPGAMARRGTAEEVAELIAFLLSSQSSFVNGAVVPIDGGWVC